RRSRPHGLRSCWALPALFLVFLRLLDASNATPAASSSASAASQPPNFRHSAAENTVNRQGTGLIYGGTQDRHSNACPVPACARARQRRCALPGAGAAGLPWFFPDCTRHRGRSVSTPTNTPFTAAQPRIHTRRRPARGCPAWLARIWALRAHYRPRRRHRCARCTVSHPLLCHPSPARRPAITQRPPRSQARSCAPSRPISARCVRQPHPQRARTRLLPAHPQPQPPPAARIFQCFSGQWGVRIGCHGRFRERFLL
ncbi:hypothetical protein DFH08DRAFT_1085985, partial [Mycena albidolilacea]